MRVPLLITLALVSTMTACSAADPVPAPSSTTVYAMASPATARSVLDSKRDDALVTLVGRLVRQVKHEKYEFADDTGTVIVEIDDKYLRGLNVTAKTLVRLEGEIDVETFKPNTVDVHRVTVLQP